LKQDAKQRSVSVHSNEAAASRHGAPARIVRSSKRVWVDAMSAARCRGNGFDFAIGLQCIEITVAAWSECTSLTESLEQRVLLPRSVALTIDPPPPKATLRSMA
jgi:hypothetical protein